MQEYATRAAARYHRLKELGLCPQCGGERDRPGLLLCAACVEKAKARYRAEIAAETPEQRERRLQYNNMMKKVKRDQFRAEGRCLFCREPAVPGQTLCVRHREEHRRRERERYARKKREGKRE